MATTRGERAVGDEGDAVADRVHAPKSQTGTGVQSGDRRALGAQDEDQGQRRRARQGTGERGGSPNNQLGTRLQFVIFHLGFFSQKNLMHCFI